MSGYEKYDRAMQNRVIQNYSIQVGTPEGVNLLKRYLYDHFDGSAFGGLANFQIASGGMILGTLPESSADAGAPIITTFGSGVGHGMTIVDTTTPSRSICTGMADIRMMWTSILIALLI